MWLLLQLQLMQTMTCLVYRRLLLLLLFMLCLLPACHTPCCLLLLQMVTWLQFSCRVPSASCLLLMLLLFSSTALLGLRLCDCRPWPRLFGPPRCCCSPLVSQLLCPARPQQLTPYAGVSSNEGLKNQSRGYPYIEALCEAMHWQIYTPACKSARRGGEGGHIQGADV